MCSTTASHSDPVRFLSSVFIIVQSDTRNREYLISCLLKKVLNSYFLSKVLFPSRYFLRAFTFWKELACLFYKSPLLFLTFVNCEGPYRGTSLQHCSMLRYCVCAIRSHPENKFDKIVAVAERYLIITHVKK